MATKVEVMIGMPMQCCGGVDLHRSGCEVIAAQERIDDAWRQEVYTQKDFTAEMVESLTAAAAYWAQLCAKYIAEHGDQGTCVIGAGIAIRFQAPRKRSPSDLIVIAAPGGQGSLVWEDSVDEILAFLRGHGVEAHYCAGRMD